MSKKLKDFRGVAAFLALTLLLSAPFYALILSSGSLAAHGRLPVLGLMWAPGVAGIVTALALRRTLRGMGWGWGGTRYQLASYFVPLEAALVVYGIAWLTGLAGFAPENFTAGLAASLGSPEPLSLGASLLVAATVGVAMSAVSALGEEIGWRGFLVPELAKHTSFARTALVSGAVWTAYHLPLILLAGYGARVPRWFAIPVFTVEVMAVAFILAWLRLRSGSLWTAVILHASHNLFIQGVFDGLTVPTDASRYVTTEFGIGLAVVYSLFAWRLWRRRGDLPAAGAAPAAAASGPARSVPGREAIPAGHPAPVAPEHA